MSGDGNRERIRGGWWFRERLNIPGLRSQLRIRKEIVSTSSSNQSDRSQLVKMQRGRATSQGKSRHLFSGRERWRYDGCSRVNFRLPRLRCPGEPCVVSVGDTSGERRLSFLFRVESVCRVGNAVVVGAQEVVRREVLENVSTRVRGVTADRNQNNRHVQRTQSSNPRKVAVQRNKGKLPT